MRPTLIAGNWKMNGSLAANQALIGALLGHAKPACEVAVCVPAPYLAQAAQLLAGSWLKAGAQDVSRHASGAYTGEQSAAMLQEFGCRYVIVGHSERRAYHGESDADVAAKTVAALQAGMTPIVCVGETQDEREQDQTERVIARQLDAVLEVLNADALAKIVIAYEPVWAIGTGKTATPDMAQQVHGFIRARLAERSEVAAQKVAILYGGSMKPDNAAELLAMADIDGGLIGGAALKAPDFLAIVDVAEQL